ncbi:MAG: four helix bundle protein [Akkermansiaceae bacterium]|nr:four helix bundle protein [Akkermansiaceae bacterium]
MKDFKKLKVWEKAHAFVLSLYEVTGGFPKDELFGLTSQIRRASVSIPSNIAEGCGRNSDADLARFCDMAMGSASEAEYQLLLSRDLGYINSEIHIRLEAELLECKKMLNAFIQRLRESKPNGISTPRDRVS